MEKKTKNDKAQAKKSCDKKGCAKKSIKKAPSKGSQAEKYFGVSDRERAAVIVAELKGLYPEAVCALEHSYDPWRLMVQGRLSAQCTDKRVNIVSGPLFERYPTAADMAEADFDELAELVRPCGLYRTKAQNLIDASRMIISRFGGSLPREMDELLMLPGVGRKIANLLRGDVFGLPAIVADTHCIRIAGRLGFYPEGQKDPYKTEMILAELIEPQEQSDFCHRIVMLGRDICTARVPMCDGCPLRGVCLHAAERQKQ